ncbi:MAG: hypothetical protein ACRDYY_10915 [Acidimicrobiales bacterium]
MDFARSMERLRTDEGTSPGELEIIAGNILDLAKPEPSATGTSDGPAEER